MHHRYTLLRSLPRWVALLGTLGVVASCQTARWSGPLPVVPRGRVEARLAPFGTDAALRTYVRELSDALRRYRADVNAYYAAQASGSTAGGAASGGTSTSSAPGASSGSTGSAPGGAQPSITNNQEQGVDEGDIVKVHGDHLVVLRRGRLFTVRVRDGALTPAFVTNAFGPGGAPADWYDEMLLAGDTVVVVGYSYRGGGTEVGLFDIDGAGRIAHRETVFVRSGDYYSARNYASRVIGQRLVLYAPVPLFEYAADANGALHLPAIRRRANGAWSAIVDAARLYRPIQPAGGDPVVHTVMFCDLAARPVACRAEGVIGPPARNFYVSASAVYVWVTGEVASQAQQQQNDGSVLYRMPLDGGPLGAVRARGGPTDQFSFREDGGELAVLVRADSRGDGMWGAEVAEGDVALLRLPVAGFGPTAPRAHAGAYTALPRPAGAGATSYDSAFQNRFAGASVLYGTGTGWGAPGARVAQPVFVHSLARRTTARLALPHGVDRIEPLGSDAVVIGTDGADLHFSSIALDPARDPAVVHDLVRPGAAQGETRSHGFFFHEDARRNGTLGLPVRASGAQGDEQLWEGSASVVFLRVDALRFAPLGELTAQALRAAPSDGCVASCVDWYGNARPIFFNGRVLALMGYELIEGRVESARLLEATRTDYLRALQPARVAAPSASPH